jgi:hypothetical protein
VACPTRIEAADRVTDSSGGMLSGAGILSKAKDPGIWSPGDFTGQLALAPLPVAAYTSVDFSLAAAVAQLPLPLPYCSIRIQHSGLPGSVQAQVTSVEAKSNLIVDSHVQNEGNGWAGSGANPWHLDENTESILFLTDESDQPARMGFSVTANSVRYSLTELQLSPHETRVIDLRKLRDAQLPDFQGKLIPADATDGSVTWVRLDNVAVMGRLMVINRGAGMASSYDCCVCPCCMSHTPALDYLSPASSSMAVGGSVGLIYYAGYTDCNGYTYEYKVNSGAAWSSAQPSIATVNSTGVVTGQSAGATSVTGQYSAYTYYYNPYLGCFTGVLQTGNPSGPTSVKPTITSISPSQGLVGTGISVTISGTGFASGASVSAGSNISVSNVSVVSSTQITATFTPTNSTSAGGNQSVTVSAAGQTSNSVNFFNQYPLHLGRIDEAGTPNNGQSATTSGTSITITMPNGTPVASGVCGGYMWLTYALADQAGNQIKNGTVTFNESFSNISPAPDPFGNPVPAQPSSPNLANQVLSDIYAIYNSSPPSCPPANASDSFNQQWTATVGTVSYPLTTVISITRSTNSQGLPSFTSTITMD